MRAYGANPYLIPPGASLAQPGDVWVDAPNLNPPLVLPLFQALARLEPQAAFRVWYAVSLALFALAVALLRRAYGGRGRRWRVGWALGLAAPWVTLAGGQVYLPLLLGAVGAWLALRRDRPAPAGILIGVVVALKPNFLVWPALLLVAGAWAPALVALGTAAVLGLAPVLLYGPGIYRAWLEAVAVAPALAGGPGNASLAGLAARLDRPWLGTLASVALLLALAVWARRAGPDVPRVSGPALVAALLVSPLAWEGYCVVLLPVLFGRPWSPPLRVAAIALTTPFYFLLGLSGGSPWRFVIFGSLYTWVLALTLVALLAEGSGSRLRSGWPGSAARS